MKLSSLLHQSHHYSANRCLRHSFLGFLILACLLLNSSLASAAPLSGTKTIGPTGDYATLTAAIADIQTQTLGGALVLELQSNYVSGIETFPLVFTNLGTTATNTLTIRPQAGATARFIAGEFNTTTTVDLDGAQYVSFDGRPGGVGSNAGSGGGTASQLTIDSYNTAGVALRFINEASNNSLRYVTVRGRNTGSSGTVVFSTTTSTNGNDYNTLDHCDIRDGVSTPANGVYSSGTTTTTAQNNCGNTISNCNIFNFNGSANSAGIYLSSGSTDWTIIGNSFYQTATRTAVAAEVWAVYLGTGSNMVVSNNFIGGSAPGAGGTAWTTTGTTAAYRFTGIELRVGPTTPSSVQGNTIQNMVWTSNSNLTASSGVWCGIYLFSGSADIGTVTGNTIGSGSSTGSVSVTTSGNGGTSFGIGSGSNAKAITIANNTIGSMTVNGTSASVSASLVGIQVSNGDCVIRGNNIGSSTTPDSLNAATSSTSGAGQQVTAISSSDFKATITGNTIANLNNSFIGNAPTGQIRGIITSAGLNTIIGNTVRNLTTTSQNSGTATSSSVLGIIDTSTTSSQIVSQNTVHSLANTAASAAVSVTGIYFAAGTSNGHLIARNLLHSLAISSNSTSALPVLIGMYLDAGTMTVQNNMVRVGLKADGTSTAGTSAIYGILDNGTTGIRKFYHNSVYLGGSQTSSSANTYTFQSNGSGIARIFQNNIFLNARSASGGTGQHFAVRYSGTGVNPVGLTAGGNLFWASGVGGVLGLYNSSLTTLAAWQTATGQDATSYNADPLFINPSGTAATVDLHVAANSPANNAGLAGTGVTNDFDGQSRSVTTPAIGADEALQPDIAVTQVGALSDGVSSVDFGTVTLGSSSAAKTFTITNPGTADLTSLAVTKDGTNAGDFTVSALSGTSVPVGSSTATFTVTFTVTFTPSAGGARSATLHIASNVTGTKNPFDIALTGSGQTVFQAWAASNTVASDPIALGSNGIKNLLNFGFGVSPASSSSGALQYTGTFAGNGSITATGQPIVRNQGSDMRAVFVRRKDFATAGLTYTVQFSANLTAWQDSTDTPAVLADDGTNQIVSVPYPVLIGGQPAKFFRINVTLAP